jgi:hydroxyacylglutathione hydrolase
MLIPITLPICNIFLLQGERPALIDTGRPRDAARIDAALERHSVAPADLSVLLHTHGHWDHCGSTLHLRERSGAVVAIHAADAELLRRGDNGVLKPTNLTARILGPLLNWRYPGVEPGLLLENGMDLNSHGIPARIIGTPGHTAGSVSVLTDEGDVIVGDLLMGGYLGGRLWPRRPGFHYFADDLETVKTSIRKLLDLHPRRIFVGHGGPLEPKHVANWLNG